MTEKLNCCAEVLRVQTTSQHRVDVSSKAYAEVAREHPTAGW